MGFMRTMGRALSAPLRAPGMGAITKPINAGIRATPGLPNAPGMSPSSGPPKPGIGPTNPMQAMAQAGPPPPPPMQQGPPPDVPIQQGPPQDIPPNVGGPIGQGPPQGMPVQGGMGPSQDMMRQIMQRRMMGPMAQAGGPRGMPQ